MFKKIKKYIFSIILVTFILGAFISLFTIKINNKNNQNLETSVINKVESKNLEIKPTIKEIEDDFDEFLIASRDRTSLNDGKQGWNAFSSLYDAIGFTITPDEASSLNKDNTRDLLNKLKSRDNQTKLTGGWSLDILTSNFDGINLNKLKFLRNFSNLTTINFVWANPTISSNDSFKIEVLSDLNWIKNLTGLKNLTIVNDYKNYTNSFASSDLNFLKELTILKLDFSNFLRSDGRSVFNGFDFLDDWYTSMPYKMSILLPNNFVVPANNKIYSLSTNLGLNYEVTKVISPPLFEPTQTRNAVKINGAIYEAVVVDSKFIWPLMQSDYNNIHYVDQSNNYFKDAKPDLIEVSPYNFSVEKKALYDKYKQEFEDYTIYDPLTVTNSSTATENKNFFEQKIFFDNFPVNRVLIGGKLSWAFDKRLPKYRNKQLTKFWSSLEKINSSDFSSELIYTIDKTHFLNEINPITQIKVDILPPKNDKEEFIIDGRKIRAFKKLSSSSYFWDLQRNNIKPEDIKFYSPELNQAFTSLNNLLNQRDDPTFSFSTYSTANIKTFDQLEVDEDLNDYPKDLTGDDLENYLLAGVEKKVIIDGIERPYRLRNGVLYIDFDISTINFIAIENNIKYFYTTTNIAARHVLSAKLLKQIPSRVIPNQKSIITPRVAKPAISSIIVDGISLNYSINQGQLYWNFNNTSITGLSEIKFVDKFGTYYTKSLFAYSKDKIVDDELNEVVPKEDDLNNTSTQAYTSIILSSKFEKFSYEAILTNKEIFIDGVNYKNRIAHSNSYWLSEDSNIASTVSNATLQEYSLAQDDKKIEQPIFYTTHTIASIKSKVFPNNIRLITTPITAPKTDFSLIPLTDPKSRDDKIIVHKNGEVITITATKDSQESDPLIWSDVNLLDEVKFANKVGEDPNKQSSYEYYVNFLESDFDSAQQLKDVSEVDKKFTKELIKGFLKKQDNILEKEDIKYILIGIFGFIFVIGATLAIWKIVK